MHALLPATHSTVAATGGSDRVVYLDHAGATLYTKMQVEEVSSSLLGGVFGNPHTQGAASAASARRVEATRDAVLRHFGVTRDE